MRGGGGEVRGGGAATVSQQEQFKLLTLGRPHLKKRKKKRINSVFR